MLPIDSKMLFSIACLFLLGPCIEILIRSAFQEGSRPRFNVGIAGLSLGAGVVLSALAYRLGIEVVPMPQPSSGAPPSGDSLAMFSLVLGVIGVILSILTGLSVAAGWRAVDESNKALRRSEEIIQYNNLAARNVLRLTAYIEAVDRASAARALNDNDRQVHHRSEIVRAFGNMHENDVLDYFENLISEHDLLLEIGGQGLRYLEGIHVGKNLSDVQRRTLHVILGARAARE